MPCAFGLAASRVKAKRWSTRTDTILGLDAARARLLASVEKDLDLDELARLACLSRCHFTRQFRLAYGVSPRELLHQERMNAAVKLLASSALSVGEAAMAVGYASQSSFCREVKKATGLTPGQIRKAGTTPLKAMPIESASDEHPLPH